MQVVEGTEIGNAGRVQPVEPRGWISVPPLNYPIQDGCYILQPGPGEHSCCEGS
jgi:hypothetical protein